MVSSTPSDVVQSPSTRFATALTDDIDDESHNAIAAWTSLAAIGAPRPPEEADGADFANVGVGDDDEAEAAMGAGGGVLIVAVRCSTARFSFSFVRDVQS